MSRDYDAVIRTPVGYVGIITGGGAVTGVELGLRRHRELAPRSVLAARAAGQLAEYFGRTRSRFDLPVATSGTAFQQRVWAALLAIPPGQTRSYGELARQLSTSARAVGGACRANPCPILVPCHRVVESGGGLGGFSGCRRGAWPAIKRRLLEHEGAVA